MTSPTSTRSAPSPLVAPTIGADGLIIEGVVTTLGESGAPHVAPMGPIVNDRLERLWLRPFQTSTTFQNLKRTGAGVFHVTDDVELLARAAIGRLDAAPPVIPATSIRGVILTEACRWYAFEVESLDDTTERTSVVARVVDRGERREFLGFNRAKHAVVEAAILATRVHLLDAEFILTEFERLAMPVGKTGAAAEVRAFELLRAYVQERLAAANGPMTSVYVSTPSRLHFGLLRLHEREGRSFGGLGMMIDRPRVELDLAAADEWFVTGPGRHRAREFAERALANVEAADKPAALRLRVASIVPQHRGLGGGTQLALAVTAGLRALVGLPPASAEELAEAVGRGGRSAVGSHGFVHGGLIWERGRIGESGVGELGDRVSLPDHWRIVLVAPRQRRGLSGLAERRAFDRLPPVPFEVTEHLETLAERQILPAAKAGALDEFGEAVYEYGRLAGACFASVQGGPYASADIAECVAAIRAFGIRGVGQSSWGPTVFAITANYVAAAELVARLHADPQWSAYGFETAAPDNRGAVVEAEPRQAISVGSVSGS